LSGHSVLGLLWGGEGNGTVAINYTHDKSSEETLSDIKGANILPYNTSHNGGDDFW